MFDGILFDLDGTLWDAVPEITDSWNRTLARRGIPRTVAPPELRACMGMLLPDIGARLLPDRPAEEREELIAQCCADENDYLARRGASLFPGEEEVLAALAARYPLFVVSNCQNGYIEAFYQGTGLGRYFTDHECAGRTGKPKGDNIALVVRRHGLQNPVYVGDTELDYEAAQAASVPFLHAAYGFGQVPGVPAARTFRDLAACLQQVEDLV